MRWNAFNLVSDSIAKTKGLLFPIKIKYWIKLWFVSLFSDIGGLTGGSSGGSNVGNSVNSATSSKTANVTGNAISEQGVMTSIISIFIFLFSLIWIALTYLRSVFTFIFIDALVSKDFKIGKAWKDNKSQGRSYFLYKIFISIVSLVVFALILSPIIFGIIKLGFSRYIDSLANFAWVSKIVPFVILAIFWAVIVGIFNTIVVTFALPHMYKNDMRIKRAIKEVFSNVRRQKLETLVSIVALFVASICCAIISIFILLVFLLIFGIIGIIIFILLLFISNWLAIAAIIIYIVCVLILFSMVALPLSVFKGYLTLKSYEKLMSAKLLR